MQYDKYYNYKQSKNPCHVVKQTSLRGILLFPQQSSTEKKSLNSEPKIIIVIFHRMVQI